MNRILSNIFRRSVGYLPFLLCFILLIQIKTFRSFSLWNGLIQVLLFLFIVCIPAYFTKRMSYIDIAWPWGLVLISLLMLIYGKGYWLRTYCVIGMYFFSGLRMGLGALILLKKGYLNSELSRYQFQRKRWRKLKYENQNISLQYEILIQCLSLIHI